jgi:hypothetical protein
MNRISQQEDSTTSFSCSNPANRSDGVLEYGSAGVLWFLGIASRCREAWAQCRASYEDSGDNRSRRSSFLLKPDFCGLSLELFARTVMSSETVLPKAVRNSWGNYTPTEIGRRKRRTSTTAATISLERRVVSKQ